MKKISVILIISAVLLAGTGFYFYMNNPKRAMLSAISKQIEHFEKSEKNMEKKKLEIKSNTEVKSGGFTLFSLNSDLYSDAVSKKNYLKFDLKALDENG